MDIDSGCRLHITVNMDEVFQKIQQSIPLDKRSINSLPLIGELRQQLDYGDPGVPRYHMFYEDIQTFQRNFTTSNGLNGCRLFEWRKHQKGLAEITRGYLENWGRGPIFWPDNPSAAWYNKLSYTRDFAKYYT
jgi:hypothetical protein